MDGSAAIERNRVALLRIVASLVAMAGLRQSATGNRQSDRMLVPETGDPAQSPTADCLPPTAATLPRHLWRAVLRLLSPAESAARRLIIAAAWGLVATPPPPRFTRSPSPASQERNLGRGRPQPGSSPVYGGGGAAGDGGGVSELSGSPRRLALPLFDPLRRITPRRIAPRDLPRICVPGWTARLPVPVRLAPSPDDPIDAARLVLRLDALARALDDLPGQARRFARWQARVAASAQIDERAAAGAQNMNPAAAASSPPSIGGEVVRHADRSGGRSSQPPHRRRFRRLSPLRGGPPPGGRLVRNAAGVRRTQASGPIREIDEILAHAHDLALYALECPDTS